MPDRPATPLWFTEAVTVGEGTRRPRASPFGPGEHGYRILLLDAAMGLIACCTFRPTGTGDVAQAARQVLAAFDDAHLADCGLVYDRITHELLFTVVHDGSSHAHYPKPLPPTTRTFRRARDAGYDDQPADPA